MSGSLRRHVGARVIVDVSEPAELVLQLAVSGMPGAGLDETFVVTCRPTVVPLSW